MRERPDAFSGPVDPVIPEDDPWHVTDNPWQVEFDPGKRPIESMAEDLNANSMATQEQLSNGIAEQIPGLTSAHDFDDLISVVERLYDAGGRLNAPNNAVYSFDQVMLFIQNGNYLAFTGEMQDKLKELVDRNSQGQASIKPASGLAESVMTEQKEQVESSSFEEWRNYLIRDVIAECDSKEHFFATLDSILASPGYETLESFFAEIKLGATQVAEQVSPDAVAVIDVIHEKFPDEFLDFKREVFEYLTDAESPQDLQDRLDDLPTRFMNQPDLIQRLFDEQDQYKKAYITAQQTGQTVKGSSVVQQAFFAAHNKFRRGV